MSKLTPAERVARGAAELDKVDPKWFRKVELRKLDLSNCCECVLGQLGNHSYSRGLFNLFRKDSSKNKRWSSLRGFFAIPWDKDEYAALTTEWKNEIRRRRNG